MADQENALKKARKRKASTNPDAAALQGGREEERLNVRVDGELFRAFKDLASRNGATMTFLVTQYMKAAVEDDDVLPWR